MTGDRGQARGTAGPAGGRGSEADVDTERADATEDATDDASSQRQDRRRVVVVGVDGSPSSAAALEVAVREARRRDASLRVVVVEQPENLAQERPHALYDPTRSGDDGASALAKRVRSSLEGSHPDVLDDLEVVPLAGRPDVVLDELSQDALLLVVGSRGKGAWRSALAGSTSMSLAASARCPLLIVPPRVAHRVLSRGMDDD